MSVSNGQAANAATFNGAFVSKTADSTTSGVLTQDKESVLKEIATPATPASGYGKIYFKSDGKLYQLNDAGIETQVGSGAGGGGGGVNFIANGDAEDNNTTGWATYADAAGASPVDGTGGTANVTISATGTTPLIGTYSFLMAKDAVNRQGQGWSYAFTIDSAYKAKVLQIDFEYQVASGTFVAGTSSADSDVTVWIYDVTNAVVIQPSSYKLLSNSSSLSSRFSATFQSASNSTSYRLIFHVATTSASAYTLEVDGISVSPSTYVYGTPVTDWQPYTPTFTALGTVTNIDFQWRRVGSDIEIRGKATAGTSTASEARISLPSVTSADTTRIATIQQCGVYISGGTSTNSHGGFVLIEPSVTYMTFGSAGTFGSTSTDPISKAIGTNVVGSNTLNLSAKIPIQGWSSSVQTSDQTDTRIVSFVGSVGSGQSLTANVTNISATSVKDSHAGWGGSSYTVQVAGDYIVSGAVSTTVIQTIEVYKNGTLISNSSWSTARSANDSSGGSITVPNCIVGDTLSLRSTVNGTVNKTYICISRITGPSAIAASEKIAMSTTLSANTAFAINTSIKYDLKLYDTHSAYSTTTGGYTAPISGLYLVSGYVYAIAGGQVSFSIFKNGVRYIIVATVDSATTQASSIASQIQLNAGDVIDIRTTNVGATHVGLGASLVASRFDVMLIK